MRHLFLLCFAFLLTAGSVSGQEAEEEGPAKAVLIPTEIVLPVVASQSDCPLKLEDVVLVDILNEGMEAQYRVRNTGTKPIRSYTIGAWNSVGTGWFSGGGIKLGNRLLLPGQTYTQFKGRYKPEIVPLTDELRDKLKLRGPMQAVVVLMITEVVFEDGTVYDANTTYEALQAHFK
jgi:hypothetical protein